MTIDTEYNIGEIVYDCLTKEKSTIVGISISVGKCNKQDYSGIIIGYWLDNNQLHGGRHPWEIGKYEQR